MGLVDFTAGQEASATDLDDVAGQVVIQCTNATRPSGVLGRHIFETDTLRGFVYTGSAWEQKSGPLDWQTPSLLNSWADVATYPPTAYALRDGILHLRGLVTGGTAGAVVFQLPVSYRPAVRIPVATLDGGGGVRFNIETTGNVDPVSSSTSNLVLTTAVPLA